MSHFPAAEVVILLGSIEFPGHVADPTGIMADEIFLRRARAKRV
jgi:hypothetical protein